MTGDFQGSSPDFQGMAGEIQGLEPDFQGMTDEFQGSSPDFEGMEDEIQGMEGDFQARPGALPERPNHQNGRGEGARRAVERWHSRAFAPRTTWERPKEADWSNRAITEFVWKLPVIRKTIPP
ncbi:MAG: hypothetical protein HZA89_18225 [Verrucomicrobia bacterium]|nr:hypothetical protein [Verrucomicrobiota bacterium]